MIGYIAFGLFIATIYAANWLIGNLGVVPVGFGLMAPAGVFAAGAAFTLRDVVHHTLGTRWVLGAIALGALASATVSPAFALASVVAFTVSELADFAVYTPFARRGWVLAVVASNLVGLTVDSYLFLTLAFGSTQFLLGQIVGKFWVTLLALPLVWKLHAVLPRHA